jgi:hypothetical protein
MAELPFQQSVWSVARGTLLDTLAQRELKKQEDAKLAREMAEQQRKAALEQDKFGLEERKFGLEERKFKTERTQKLSEQQLEEQKKREFNQHVTNYYDAMSSGVDEKTLRALAVKIMTFGAEGKDVAPADLGLAPLPTPVEPRPINISPGSVALIPDPSAPGGYRRERAPLTPAQARVGSASDPDAPLKREQAKMPPAVQDSIAQNIAAHPELNNAQIKGLFRRDAFQALRGKNEYLDLTQALKFIDEMLPPSAQEQTPNYVTSLPGEAKWALPVEPASVKPGRVGLPFGGSIDTGGTQGARPAVAPSAARTPAAAPQMDPELQAAVEQAQAKVNADWQEVVQSYIAAGQTPPEPTEEMINIAMSRALAELGYTAGGGQ